MKSYSDITLKYLKENKKRTLFTIIGIILSLSLISGVGFLGLSVRDLLYDNAITLQLEDDAKQYFDEMMNLLDLKTCNCTINDCNNCKDGYCRLCK